MQPDILKLVHQLTIQAAEFERRVRQSGHDPEAWPILRQNAEFLVGIAMCVSTAIGGDPNNVTEQILEATMMVRRDLDLMPSAN